MEITPQKRENLCLYFPMISSIRAHVSQRFYCALVRSCFSFTASILFFLDCVASSQKNEKYHREWARVLRGRGYGACIAPDIFMDLQHPNYSSNFDNLLPNTHFWHLFARFNSPRFDFGFGLNTVRCFTVRKQKCFLVASIAHRPILLSR